MDMLITDQLVLERFWDKANIGDSDECWEWKRSKDKDGYGWWHDTIKTRKAHRYSLAVKLGRDIKPGYKALHTCDNPPCVNPNHLYEGTQLDNERDKIKRKRHYEQQKTHCPSGHEYSEENTYYRPNKPWQRDCKACRKQRDLDKYRK